MNGTNGYGLYGAAEGLDSTCVGPGHAFSGRSKSRKGRQRQKHADGPVIRAIISAVSAQCHLPIFGIELLQADKGRHSLMTVIYKCAM